MIAYNPSKRYMATNKDDALTKVVPIAKAQRESEKKWGTLAMKPGFLILPSILLRAQKKLGLDSSQLVLLMHLADFWWQPNALPWPKKKTLAQRMDVTDKQIQRIAKSLEDAGLLHRIKRTRTRGQTSNAYDLSGLVQKLNAIAPEFIEAAAAKRSAEKPGQALKKALQKS